MSPEFGKSLQVMVLSCTGRLQKEYAEMFTADLIESLGMHDGAGAKTFDYGEIGFVRVHTLVESFVAIDSWHPHVEGCYLTIESCKPFTGDQVKACLERYGLTIHKTALEGVLELP